MSLPPSPERSAEIEAFLDGNGWKGTARRPVPGDASFRRYERLGGAETGRTAVLMDSPPGAVEDMVRFAGLALHLRGLGLSAPEILACDRDRGLLLLEDLGDEVFGDTLERDPSREVEFYEASVDLLAALAEIPPPAEVEFAGGVRVIPPYDEGPLWREAVLLPEWWMPAAGVETGSDLTAEYRALLLEACAGVRDCASCLVLRDCHAANLIWMPGRAGIARVGLLDFQDALAGHPAYDLVSLLEDARRDTSLELQSAMVDRHAERLGLDAAGREAFSAAYAVLGAQRNLKIVGIFTRLRQRDGKTGYLERIPRVWAHLQRDLAHPRLAELRAWVGRWVPAPTPEILARIRAGGTGG